MKAIIDSQQMRVVAVLARVLNMRKAAAELRLTPSAVSHALKALEADLGCRLFERSSGKLVLLSPGREFLAEAGQILEKMKSLRARLGGETDWRQGQLRVGASGTACEFILPPTLREFRESFPDFTIKIEQCSSPQAVALLGEDRLDLALLTDSSKFAGMQFNFIGEDDLQFFVNPLHPWAVKRKALREEIPGKKLILPERGSNTYALIEAYFHGENIRIQPFIEIANEQAIKQFARLGMGVGILPRWLAAADVERGLLVGLPLGRRRLKRRWGVVHSKGRRLTLAENLFLNICRRVFHEIVQVS